MENAKSVGLTLSTDCKLSKDQCPKTRSEKAQLEKDPYASMVGSPMYAMVFTRPDIGYAVRVVSRFMSNPGREHWAPQAYVFVSAQVNPYWKATWIHTYQLMQILADHVRICNDLGKESCIVAIEVAKGRGIVDHGSRVHGRNESWQGNHMDEGVYQ